MRDDDVLGHDRVGSGPLAVVVLNDWMYDTSTWDGARAYLDCERFSWAFADLRGYGCAKKSFMRLFAMPRCNLASSLSETTDSRE